MGSSGLVYTIPGAISTILALLSCSIDPGNAIQYALWRVIKVAGTLPQGLQIGDDVLDIGGIGEPAIGHAISFHLVLRVLDVGTQIVLVPHQACPFHRVRIAEIFERGGLASHYALEARTE